MPTGPTSPTTPPRRRTATVLLAALVTGALLLTGCSTALPAGARDTAGGSLPQQVAIQCPAVDDLLRNVPDRAQAEVAREQANLQLQITNAQARLDRELARAQRRAASGKSGEAGRATAEFDQLSRNILNDLSNSKRQAVLSRIDIAIGRTGATPPGVVNRRACELVSEGDVPAAQAAGAAPPPAVPADPAPPSNRGQVDVELVEGQAPAASDGRIVCPDVRAQLPPVPAGARANVDRELGVLDQQIAEAEQRLATSAGQGGPNFVQNAIVGPLRDKRVAVLDRIEIAIGREAPRPTGLTLLAPCELG